MTSPRYEIVIAHESHYYHCISRCVRRAFLCGFDPMSGNDYEHRKEWIRDRIFQLAAVFSIEVASYAVMSNHLHTLLVTHPEVANGWPPDEVARRWLMLFQKRTTSRPTQRPSENQIAAISQNPDLVEKLRGRLCSISWFQRCLNEYVARRANKEDSCKGRFWEGRFRCIRIDDSGGIVACSVYIDLNPIRAGAAKTPETSTFTSIYDRITSFTDAEGNPCSPERRPAVPLVTPEEFSNNSLTTKEYIDLVDSTGRAIVEGKSAIKSDLLPILDRIQIKKDAWLRYSQDLEHRFRRLICSCPDLTRAAERVSKRWFQGRRAARELFT